MVPVNVVNIKRESVILDKVKQGHLDEVQNKKEEKLSLKQFLRLKEELKNWRGETSYRKDENKSNSNTEVKQTKNIDTSRIQHNNHTGENTLFRKQFISKIYEIKDLLEGSATQISPEDQFVDEGIEDTLMTKIENVKARLNSLNMSGFSARKEVLSGMTPTVTDTSEGIKSLGTTGDAFKDVSVGKETPVIKETEKAWYDGRLYICNICRKSFDNWSVFKTHSREIHVLDITEKSKQEIILAYYTCKICDTTLKHHYNYINMHLKRRHDMKIQKYGDVYHSQTQKGQTSTNKITPLEVSSNQILTSTYEHVDQLHILDPTSKKWYNASYFICKNCAWMSWVKKDYIEHLSAVHRVKTPNNELSSFATQFEEHEYTCKICQKIMKHERPAIAHHLKHVHNLTIPEYEHLHENENSKTKSDNTVENVPDNKPKGEYNAIEADISSAQIEEEKKFIIDMSAESHVNSGIKLEIKSEPDEEARLVENIIVYCCPLDSCNFTTSREGMMDHRAATHLR